jgi:hypothetical protein
MEDQLPPFATKPRLDKRLRPARIIGYILLFLSIFGFAGNIMGGIMSIIGSLLGKDQQYETAFGGPIGLIFSHYWQCAFAFSAIWIPLFIGARGLIRFRKWAIPLTATILGFLILAVIAMGVVFLKIPWTPIFFKPAMVLVFLIYASVLIVAIYFIVRKKSRDGFDDHERGTPPNDYTSPNH